MCGGAGVRVAAAISITAARQTSRMLAGGCHHRCRHLHVSHHFIFVSFQPQAGTGRPSAGLVTRPRHPTAAPGPAMPRAPPGSRRSRTRTLHPPSGFPAACQIHACPPSFALRPRGCCQQPGATRRSFAYRRPASLALRARLTGGTGALLSVAPVWLVYPAAC